MSYFFLIQVLYPNISPVFILYPKPARSIHIHCGWGDYNTEPPQFMHTDSQIQASSLVLTCIFHCSVILPVSTDLVFPKLTLNALKIILSLSISAFLGSIFLF